MEAWPPDSRLGRGGYLGILIGQPDQFSRHPDQHVAQAHRRGRYLRGLRPIGRGWCESPADETIVELQACLAQGRGPFPSRGIEEDTGTLANVKSRDLAEHGGKRISLVKKGKTKGVRFDALQRICDYLDCQLGNLSRQSAKAI